MAVLEFTGFLSVGLLLSLAALMHLSAGGRDAFAEFKRFWRSRGRFDKMVLVALVSLMISYAGAKHGGTNSVDQTGGAATNAPPPMLSAPRRILHAPSAVPELPNGITSDALDIGLVLVGVGTDETHDFDAPTSAASVTNWLSHGAATDRVTLRFDDFSFPFGTNAVGAVSALANGLVYPRRRSDGGGFRLVPDAVFTVFGSQSGLGVVPVANWADLEQTNLPSRVWYGCVEDGAFAVTWQNVLWGRDPACPVSFQLRLHPDGAVEYRYDLSRLADDSALAGASVAVENGGASFAPAPIGRRLTSLRFARLTERDRDTSDRDGDGLSTADELFVHHTDPSLPDSDFDGLSDFAELFVHHTDPLDPNSLRTDVPDGMAVVMGSEDPFAFPAGSTNTVFEHVFYTGTTNTPFACPSDTVDAAVLKVTARGSGAGRIVVGDAVVPLLVHESAQTVCVQLPKGVLHAVWGSLPSSLQVEVGSESYTVGRLPHWYTGERGWVAFPDTRAKEPCIHDLGTGGVDVSLDPGERITGLTCTWNAATNIEVENRPPLAARLTGRFPHRSTTPISYTLDHPDYLFGETTYIQTARFCPSRSSDGAEVPDGGEPARAIDEEFGDDEEDGVGDDGDVDEEDTPLDICRIHGCPQEQCEILHLAAYTNALAAVTNDMTGILRLDRDPSWRDPIAISVPDTSVRCCPCPDHWTNYVALASKSYNLAVHTAGGERFAKTVEDCTVYVSGLAPSRDFDDSVVSLCKTGVVYETRRYTVLGLKIDCRYLDIAKLNRANPDFGLPVVACTNKAYGTVLRLRTDVDLPDGDIHIGFSDPTPGFRLYLGYPTDGTSTVWDGGEPLADSAAGGSFDVSLKQWKRILRDRGNGREVFVTLVAEHEGAADLEFGYTVERNGVCKGDFVTQRLTAIRSPLMADYNHNGGIDAADRELLRTGHPFRFWTNDDRIKTDVVPVPLPVIGGIVEWLSPEPYNIYDYAVNGTYDLLNLFPVAIDLGVLTNRWKDANVTFAVGGLGSSLNVTFADIAWDSLRTAQTNDVMTVDGMHLREATLYPLGRQDIALDDSILGRFGEESGVMLAESTWWDSSAVTLKACIDGAEVFRAHLPIRTRSVRDMYRWINARHLSDEAEDRATDVSLPDNAPYGVEGMKKLIFLHGANVAEPDAEFWGEQLFKRFWHSGFDVDFYNVDWRGDMGTDANYQQNVSNAFEVAARLAPTIAAIPGDKLIMAHSLGNVVVSSMMQDHGLTNSVSEYIVCNSAVPSEAYAEADDVSIRVPQLVHPDWESYPTNSWASNWHKLFKDDVGDDRKLLGWPARFRDVTPFITTVFYSKGDEVLEMYVTNSISVLTGVTNSLGNLAWHKQELFKGRGLFNGLGATTWAGWNIDENIFGVNKISVEEAIAMDCRDPSEFKTNTVFYCYPPSMNQRTIPLLVRGAHLAMGIPALAPSVGWTGLTGIIGSGKHFDENDSKIDSYNGILRPNRWPTRSNYKNRWLHSDMKDVSYFFNFMFYEKLKEKGGF